jgi:hypothetical protein
MTSAKEVHAMNARSYVLAGVLIAISLLPQGTADAQGTRPPWPDGCSVRLPPFIQNGLDRIFFGACNRHDLCWARCNSQFGPYLDVGHKFGCDFTFLIEMEAACAAWSVVLSYPGSGWIDSDDFLEACSGVAGTFATAVNTPLGFGVFWRSQCARGCNPTACTISPPWNPQCGVSQCFVYAPLPGPPDPPQPDDPCIDPDSSLRAVSITGDEQLSGEFPDSAYPLLRDDNRDGFHYRLEEWAVIAVEVAEGGRIAEVRAEGASTPAYGAFQRRALVAADRNQKRGGRRLRLADPWS